MADKKQKQPRLVTPKGVAIFPWLNKPDTKFNPEGQYRVKLRLPAEAAQPLIDKLEAMRQEAIAKWKANPKNKGKKCKEQDTPWQPVLDEEGDETGEVTMNFKRRASGVSQKTGEPWSIKPDLFDRDGNKLPSDAQIFGGSVLKVSFTPNVYDTAAAGVGVSLSLDAAKVLKLVDSNRSADSYGFGDDSDDDDADDDKSTDTGSTDDADGDSDF